MKKILLIIVAVQFSLSCFSQTESTHHYTDKEVSKLTNYISELEKKITAANLPDSNVGDKKQVVQLLNDSSHNYFDRDIITIFKYIKDLEKKVALYKMSINTDDEVPQAPILLVFGNVVFVDEEPQSNHLAVMLTVTDKLSNEIIGIYTSNSKTGNYLFILTPGKKYFITAKAVGYQLYTENFSPENKNESYETTQEIKLKKL
jgi:hypothetical protein